MLPALLFAIVVDVTKDARRDVINELPFADDLILMNERMEDRKGFGIGKKH